jgi:hypothetical protein
VVAAAPAEQPPQSDTIELPIPTKDPVEQPNEPTSEAPSLAVNHSTKTEASDGFEDTIVFNDPQVEKAEDPPKVEEFKDPVAIEDTSASSTGSSPSSAELLATVTTPKKAVEPKRTRKRSSRSSSRGNKSKAISSAPVPGDPLQGLTKAEIGDRVDEIGKRFDQTTRLSSAEVNLLKKLTKSHGTAYNSAHRILGSYYYNIKEYRRQKDSLEIATQRGRYRSDAKVLLSLAQTYGHFKQYAKALKVLRRTEAKMRRLKGSEKANVYRTYAEYARLYFIAQRAKNPLRADSSLLDTAIQKWKRLQSISSSGSKDASDARKQIQKLEQMKSEAGMP